MTTAQLTAHAMAQKPHVKLVYAGFQQGFRSIPGRKLYNVTGGDYALGSTVTVESMEARGFEVVIATPSTTPA